eukprot:COSAG06_NODE_53195_length_301_cov_1.014851_1_plen_88_part_10
MGARLVLARLARRSSIAYLCLRFTCLSRPTVLGTSCTILSLPVLYATDPTARMHGLTRKGLRLCPPHLHQDSREMTEFLYEAETSLKC